MAIVDFFGVHREADKPKPRFTILVDGYNVFTVVSETSDNSFMRFKDTLYFKDMKFYSLDNAKAGIDKYLETEQKSATRPVCQYP